MFKKAILTVIALILFVSLAYAGDTKIGIVDVPKILKASLAGQEAKDAFKREVAANRKLLAERDKETRRLEADLKKERSASARREKEERLRRELKELKRLKTDIDEELKRKERELTAKLIKEIMAVVNEIGVMGKYTLILERGKVVLYTTNAIDITNDVLKRYDKIKKKELRGKK